MPRGRRLSRLAQEQARRLAHVLRHRGDRVVLSPMEGEGDVHGRVTRCWHWMRSAVEVPGGVLYPGQPSRLEVQLDGGEAVALDVHDPARRWYVASWVPRRGEVRHG